MGAGCLLVGIFKLIAAITYMRTTELAVTDRRVIGKWGFIQRDTIEQRLEKVDSTIVHQSMFGRLMDFGDIVVHGSGTTQTPIRMIVNPLSFRKAVDVGTAAFESRRTDTFSLQAN